MRTVSLMTANQEFSKLIKEVEHGEGFLVASGLGPGELLITEPLQRVEDGTAVRARKGPEQAR